MLTVLSIKHNGEFWVATVMSRGVKYEAKFLHKPSKEYVHATWQQDLGSADWVRVK